MAEVLKGSVRLGEYGIYGQFTATPREGQVSTSLWNGYGHASVEVSPNEAEEMAALLWAAAAEARA